MTDTATFDLPVFSDISAAHSRIKGLLRHTPVISDPGLNQMLGCEVFCKCENLQHSNAFKFRGACNAILQLNEQGYQGDVATHSSGNHGAALALAATQNGRQAHVVMPENALAPKIEAVKANGGIVHFCEPTQKAREAGLAKLVALGHVAIPPYDHRDIIAGQGTATLELMDQQTDLDIVMTPVGGGGLISGTAIAAKNSKADIAVIGAEPEGAADTAESLRRGERVTEWQPNTIADGLRALVGVRNFAIIQQHVDQVITVSETSIVEAMALVWRRLRLLIEPSSAVVIAAITSQPEIFAGKKVGLIITGGNVDLKQLPF